MRRRERIASGALLAAGVAWRGAARRGAARRKQKATLPARNRQTGLPPQVKRASPRSAGGSRVRLKLKDTVERPDGDFRSIRSGPNH